MMDIESVKLKEAVDIGNNVMGFFNDDRYKITLHEGVFSIYVREQLAKGLVSEVHTPITNAIYFRVKNGSGRSETRATGTRAKVKS